MNQYGLIDTFYHKNLNNRFYKHLLWSNTVVVLQ